MNKNRLLRVGIYLRLSNEDKNKQNINDDSESIKNQRNLILQYIKKNPNFSLIDEYCDEDLSGAGTYRPEFERLIKDCESKKIDVVLCKSQSRFSRDMEIVEKYINNKFIEWNIRFIGISDNADTDILGNKKSRQINGLVNEWYLEDVSNNIKSAFKSKMKQGEFISPFAAFGYEISKSNNNKLVIDHSAANIVKKIFNLYLKGLGYTGIANYLNNKNIPSPSLYKYQKGCKLNIISNKPREEIKWNANAIKTILTNELYLGHLIQGKRTTISYKNHKIITKSKDTWIKKENTHEPIIDKKTFKLVNSQIKSRSKETKIKKSIHNFSGKVFCLECKQLMKKKNSQRHSYLTCKNNYCHNTSIRYDQLEKIILQEINNKIEKYYDKDLLKELLMKKKLTNSLVISKKELENKILKNKNYLRNIYEDKVNKIISTTEFIELKQLYIKNEELLKNQINNLNKEINRNQQLDNIEKYKNLQDLNPTITQEFIKNIYVSKINKKTNTRDIEIKWNFE